MQCKDIPTLPILKYILSKEGTWCNWFEKQFPSGRLNDNTIQYAMPDNLPDNLILAKMSKLIRRGYVAGCDCGCRGDYEITEKGKLYIKNRGKKELI